MKKSYIYNIGFADFNDDRDKNCFALSKVSSRLTYSHLKDEDREKYKRLAHDLIVSGVCPVDSDFIEE